MVKKICLPLQETWVRSLGGEDPLEEEMTTHGNPLQSSCLENPTDRGVWRGYSPRGRKESEMTEHIHMPEKLPRLGYL